MTRIINGCKSINWCRAITTHCVVLISNHWLLLYTVTESAKREYKTLRHTAEKELQNDAMV